MITHYAGQWPMLQPVGMKLRISDGYGLLKRKGRGHLGVDLMYRREKKGLWDRPECTPWYWCPSNSVPVLSCQEGRVVRILTSKRQGGAVYIDHGDYLSVYRHLALDSVLVYNREVVSLGQRIGTASHAPKAGRRGINHLHFELWKPYKRGPRWSRRLRAVNPEPHMKHWKKPREVSG